MIDDRAPGLSMLLLLSLACTLCPCAANAALRAEREALQTQVRQLLESVTARELEAERVLHTPPCGGHRGHRAQH